MCILEAAVSSRLRGTVTNGSIRGYDSSRNCCDGQDNDTPSILNKRNETVTVGTTFDDPCVGWFDTCSCEENLKCNSSEYGSCVCDDSTFKWSSKVGKCGTLLKNF